MKSRLSLVGGCSVLFAALAAPVSAATITYSNTVGSSIGLDPTDGCGGGVVGCFSFSAGNSIQITSGTASGFTGGIGGQFGVGAISAFGGVETTGVNGIGVLTIFDGSTVLTADLTWVDIATYGVAGSLNAFGSANLSHISYGGTNGDLVALANSGAGTQTATFQFASPTSLTNLFTTSTAVSRTSFSGSISTVPVPAAIWLLGSALLGLAGAARHTLNDTEISMSTAPSGASRFST